VTRHQAATVDALMAQTGFGPLYATDRTFRAQVDHLVDTLAPAMVRACADTITCDRLAQDFVSDQRSSSG
jgi:hypothetical protein